MGLALQMARLAYGYDDYPAHCAGRKKHSYLLFAEKATRNNHTLRNSKWNLSFGGRLLLDSVHFGLIKGTTQEGYGSDCDLHVSLRVF